MASFTFPCFKIGSLTRIDANTMDVHGLIIFLDEDSNGKCDRRYPDSDFRITDVTGLGSKAKVAAAIKTHVQAIIAAAPWTPPVVETPIAQSIGIVLAVSNLATVTDPDSDKTSFDTVVN